MLDANLRLCLEQLPVRRARQQVRCPRRHLRYLFGYSFCRFSISSAFRLFSRRSSRCCPTSKLLHAQPLGHREVLRDGDQGSISLHPNRFSLADSSSRRRASSGSRRSRRPSTNIVDGPPFLCFLIISCLVFTFSPDSSRRISVSRSLEFKPSATLLPSTLSFLSPTPMPPCTPSSSQVHSIRGNSIQISDHTLFV